MPYLKPWFRKLIGIMSRKKKEEIISKPEITALEIQMENLSTTIIEENNSSISDISTSDIEYHDYNNEDTNKYVVHENADPTSINIKEYIYYVYFDENEEYYLNSLPCILDDRVEMFGVIYFNKIVENILNTTIEVTYREDKPPQRDSSGYIIPIVKNIKNGILIKALEKESLEWLDRTKRSAEELIKEKTLLAYKNTVPKLVNQISQLQETVQIIQQQNQVPNPINTNRKKPSPRTDGFVDLR